MLVWIADFTWSSISLPILDRPHGLHPILYPALLCDPYPKGSFTVSEEKDISRQRLADFLAARLRARADSDPESQRSRNESSSIGITRPDEHATPSTAS
jgi:hypothetical protein